MTIHGARYRDPDNDGLARFIERELPYLDYGAACQFYEDILPALRGKDIALLGCNDRFFLLTVLLGNAYVRHPWMYDRCREVELEPFGHLDLWARYHGKTTILTFGGSIQGVLQDPEITIGIFAATNKIAKPFLAQIMREFETNERLKQVYSDVLWTNPRTEAPSWSLQNGIVVRRKGNPKENSIEAYGLLDGMPTGRHFMRLVYDDLINQEHVTNPEMIQKVTERWELSDNLGCGEATQVQACGTRYGFGETYGIILKRGVLEPRIYPATDNGRLDGKPVFMSPEHWEKVKNTQRSVVSAQMLQNPIAGQENTFKPEWFSPWEVRPSHLSVYIMGDPSSGRSKSSDRTAFAAVGIDGAGNKYFLDGYRHRMSLSERWLALKNLYRKWVKEPGVVHVAVGYERYGMQADLEYFQERMRKERAEFHIDELNWPREGAHSKKARVERLEPDFRLGRFYLPATVFEPGKGDCFWHVDEAKSTIVSIPAKGRTGNMEKMARAHLDHLLARSIRRLDEDKKPYDVTMALMEEMLFFPFAPRDDLVDAVSRIYDMDVRIPDMFEDRDAELINNRDWADA